MGLPTKTPFKSLGIIGSASTIVSSLIALAEWYNANQDLIMDTKTAVVALWVALASGVVSLVGRWRARLPISLTGEKVKE